MLNHNQRNNKYKATINKKQTKVNLIKTKKSKPWIKIVILY